MLAGGQIGMPGVEPIDLGHSAGGLPMHVDEQRVGLQAAISCQQAVARSGHPDLSLEGNGTRFNVMFSARGSVTWGQPWQETPQNTRPSHLSRQRPEFKGENRVQKRAGCPPPKPCLKPGHRARIGRAAGVRAEIPA